MIDTPNFKYSTLREMPDGDIRSVIIAGFEILAEREETSVTEVIEDCLNGIREDLADASRAAGLN